MQSVRDIEAAASAGAGLILLPELVIPGYVLEQSWLQGAAEPIDGPTCAAWTASARKLGVLIAGGFCEADAGSLYNTAVLIGPDGLLLHYRKLHLFDQEKKIFAPGNRGLNVVETSAGKIGICVCYDLRFVEVMRSLALQSAEIILVPTAWVGGFDKGGAEAHALIGQAQGVAVQANLNQVYVACASQSGVLDETQFLGSSLIVDPYGKVIAGPAPRNRGEVVCATIDLAQVQKAQERSSLIKPRLDRRTDVYQLWMNGRLL